MYKDVREFHRKILAQDAPMTPTVLPPRLRNDRINFMWEELIEFENAHNIVDQTDAMLDLVYVALGTLYLMGIDADTVWKFVQDANMQKVRGITKRGMEYDAVKPPGWVAPEGRIKAYLEEQGYKE